MYFAEEIEKNKFFHFSVMISQTVKGRTEYKEYINSIIQDVIDFTTGSKNLYQIDKGSFQIIVSLSDVDKKYFSSLKNKKITCEVYKKVFDDIKKITSVNTSSIITNEQP